MSSQGPNTVIDIKKKFTGMKEALDLKEEECDNLNRKIREYTEQLNQNETELAGHTRRIQLLEEELDSTSTRLQTALDMLDEASKAADESERARKVLENKSNLDYERMTELEKLAKSYHQQAQEWEQKYDEVARKNVCLETSLASKEDQCDDREKKLQESDCQLESFSSSIKSFQIAIDKASQREETYEETIRDLTERLKDLTCKYDELQGNYKNAVRQINELEEECVSWKKKYQKLEDEFQMMMSSLQEM